MSFEQRLLTSTAFGASYTNWPNISPATAALPDGTVFYPSGRSDVRIAPRDLVAAFESGWVVPVDPILGATAAVNNTAGPVAIVSDLTVQGSNYLTNSSTGAYALPVCCELNNKDIAMVTHGNGTTTDTGVSLHIRTPTGEPKMPLVTVTSATTISHVSIWLIRSSGRVVIAWAESVATLKFAVYNADGTVFASPVTVTSALVQKYTATVLLTGDVVFLYGKSSPINRFFSRYSEAGVLQGSETTVEVNGGASEYQSMITCANGDFIVLYYRNIASEATKIARYSSTGSVVVALTTIRTGSYTQACANGSRAILELPNGNFAILAQRATDTYPNLYIYSSTLTLVREVQFYVVAVPIGNQIPAMCVTAAGGVAVAWANSTNLYIRQFDSAGLALGGEFSALTALSIAPNSLSNSSFYLFQQGAAGYTFVSALYDNSTNYAVNIHSFLPNGTLRGSRIILNGSTSVISSLTAIMSSQGVVVGAYSISNTNNRYFSYKTMLASIIGVAQTPGSQNVAAQISTKGSFRVNQSIATANFDCRAYTVPGTKGQIFGKSAVLTGLV